MDDDYKLKILIKQFLDKHPLSSLNFLIDSIPGLNNSELEILKKEYAFFEEERKKKKFSFEIEEDSNKGKNLLKYFVKMAFFLSSIIIGLVIPNYNVLSLSALGFLIIGITGVLNNTVFRYNKYRIEDGRSLFRFVSPIPLPNGMICLYFIGVIVIILDIYFQILLPGVVFT